MQALLYPIPGLPEHCLPSKIPEPGRSPAGKRGRGGCRRPPTKLATPSEHLELDDLTGAEQTPNYKVEWAEYVASSKESHEFHEIFCCTCGEIKAVPVYCKNRFCPVCAQSRKFKIQERLRRLIDLEKPTHSRRLKHLILTQKNSRDPAEGADRIVRAFKRLRQTALWKSKSISGAWVIEVTGSPEHWHVHIHAVIISKFISVLELTDEWTKLTRATHVKLLEITPEDAIDYLSKYVTKGKFNPLHVLEIAAALRSTRMFNVFGLWHNAKIAKVKLVCTCPICKGTKWNSVVGYMVSGTQKDVDNYIRDLKRRWRYDPGRGSGENGNQ
jgi:hypothetical protein